MEINSTIPHSSLGTKKLKEQLDLNNNGEHINERFFKV
jgi:hypothetical protein